MKWKDSRVYKPNCNSCCRYPVIYLHAWGSFTGKEGSVGKGFATWMPKNNYTDGDWIEIQIQMHSGKYDNMTVLYWMDIEEYPEGVLL